MTPVPFFHAVHYDPRRRMDQFFLDVISGRRRGLTAGALRGALALCAPLYGLAVAVRNSRYDRGAARVHHAGVPVVSVGNITTGGTGKTPTVAWIVNRLRELVRRPGILSRGYRSLDGQENDEKRLLDQLCPGVPHLQGPDRVATAARAIREHGCDMLVLDDGFQHRRLHRDLDIVLIDALNPWGYGRLLPRGLLRERPASLRRAHLIVITRADQSPSEGITSLRAEIARYTSVEIVDSRFEPTGLVNAAGERLDLSVARGRRVAAFCGTGNPAAFRATLQHAGVTIDEALFRVFPDHHHYTREECPAVANFARHGGADLLLTTRKDLVKVRETALDGIPLWAVEIAFRPGPVEPLMQRLQALCPPKIAELRDGSWNRL
jgi:tetraacyldisaccharide 4'-kinase